METPPGCGASHPGSLLDGLAAIRRRVQQLDEPSSDGVQPLLAATEQLHFELLCHGGPPYGEKWGAGIHEYLYGLRREDQLRALHAVVAACVAPQAAVSAPASYQRFCAVLATSAGLIGRQ